MLFVRLIFCLVLWGLAVPTQAAPKRHAKPRPNCWVIVDYKSGLRRSFYARVTDENTCQARAEAHNVSLADEALQKAQYKFGKVPNVR